MEVNIFKLDGNSNLTLSKVLAHIRSALIASSAFQRYWVRSRIFSLVLGFHLQTLPCTSSCICFCSYKTDSWSLGLLLCSQ